jgi:Rieske Fe-S protein
MLQDPGSQWGPRLPFRPPSRAAKLALLAHRQGWPCLCHTSRFEASGRELPPTLGALRHRARCTVNAICVCALRINKDYYKGLLRFIFELLKAV